ncbi:MAG: hypothetical protein OD918_08275 [Gammaproteobacteria bacterium]
MTAQVAVMNTLGIALASDSAVTVSSGAGKTRKIYSSSDKLFQLSDVAPVAIMFSGVADFLGMPWETVIKVHRDQLGEKTFPKLSDYVEDFFRFVRTNTKMFPQSARDDCIEYIVWDLFDDVLIESKRRHKDSNSSAEKAEQSMSTIIHEVAIESLKAEKEHKKITGFGAAMDRTMRAKYGQLIAKERKDVFKNYRLPPKTQCALDNLIFESISRTNFRSMETVIVFAGFGEDEYMPTCIAYAVEGMLEILKEKFRCHHIKEQISPENTAMVWPFAQSAMVHTFLDGISPQIESDLKDALIDESFSEKLKEAKENFREPFVVESFPKDELVAMAETLVNLTKFRLRVTSQQETVGGPIDVAVITKGDGFVWVKKKQYFPAELNPHKTGRPV